MFEDSKRKQDTVYLIPHFMSDRITGLQFKTTKAEGKWQVLQSISLNDITASTQYCTFYKGAKKQVILKVSNMAIKHN